MVKFIDLPDLFNRFENKSLKSFAFLEPRLIVWNNYNFTFDLN